MSDIFNSPYKSTESYTAAGATLTWSHGSKPGTTIPMLAVGVDINFVRRITPQYVLNTTSATGSTLINVIGAPSGVLTIDSILTPFAEDMTEFLKAIGSDCVSKDNAVTVAISPFTRTCNAQGKTTTWTLTGVIGQGLNMRVQDQQGIISTTCRLSAVFTNLTQDSTNVQPIISTDGSDAAVNLGERRQQ